MIRNTIIATLAAVTFMLAPLTAKELDGSQWKAQDKGWKFWNSDTFAFNGDTFRSENYAEKGFSGAGYQASKDGEKVTWNSVQTNPQGEKLEWNGVSSGNAMDGTVTHTAKDGKTKTTPWKAELALPENK